MFDANPGSGTFTCDGFDFMRIIVVHKTTPYMLADIDKLCVNGHQWQEGGQSLLLPVVCG
ncbi:hypothetical protein KDH_38750 [Dictyobacter sp. S3.2.2.5]|uniref:Uncharacterized protein n=1 Tax=Dictyobacter halimunensis TaxID=3026934 RepID=A0ABQ6FS15_9CHLR|nr:hypothetical protein KDH_38750 [Dictyobacter sp. S3.2.2.5]